MQFSISHIISVYQAPMRLFCALMLRWSNVSAAINSTPDSTCVKYALPLLVVMPVLNVLMTMRPTNAPPMPPVPPLNEMPPRIADVIPVNCKLERAADEPIRVREALTIPARHPRTAPLINRKYDIFLG